MDPRYLTGLIEGAGTFTYSRSGKQLALYFGIKLGDVGVLEDVQAYFEGAGRIYGTHYRITHRYDLARVVEHLDAYPLRGSKQRSFEIWRQMVELKRAFRKPERSQLAELAVQLTASR